MTDLDRYGLFALAVVILLILFVSLGKMEYGDDSAAVAAAPSAAGRLPPASSAARAKGDRAAERPKRAASMEREDFDFSEAPLPFAGGDVVRAGEDPAREENPEEVSEKASIIGEFILHRVRKGETLTSIAKNYYGSESGWRVIARANGGLVPEKLMAGRMIRVPRKLSAALPLFRKRSGAAQDVSFPARYVVRKNDTLAGISQRFYGTARKWRKIFEANRGRISDPDRLDVGVRLLLPP